MTALRIVQVAVSLSFLALGVFTVADWLRHRERSRGYLALALGTLGLTSVLGQVNTLTNDALGVVISDLSLILFMVSGYALLLFRDSFIPLSREIRVGAAIACVVSLVAYLAVGYPASPQARPTALQSIAVIAIILVWSGCVLEPVLRFWAASRQRPAVQRARLRALGGGYAAIVVILVIAGFGGSAATSPTVQWVFEIVAVIALPLLLVGFAPPRWLRRIWREPEVDRLRDALHDLVLVSPDRPTLARRAAQWGSRLVGADGVAIVDADGQMLALEGMDATAAQQLAAQVDKEGRAQLLATPGSPRENAIVIPLPVDAGTGAMVVVSGPFTPFFGTDEVGQLRAYAVNITAALDRERVTERLAALDKMKSQFLNLASHELRSPLGVINGYLSMLEQGALGQLKEAGVRAIEVLKAKTLDMNLLVAQMLDAARLEDGKLVLKREHLDLRRIANEALQVVRPMASARHQLTLETPSDEVPVFGDDERLVTIVTNLLENAVKYSPNGGLVRCLVDVDGQSARLRVIDTGVGISADDVPRLFNRFERLQNPQTTHVGGTGLGLYLSRELARQHGGDIEVQSQPAAGSTFTLVLPVTRPVLAALDTQAPLQQPPAPAAPAAPRLHVLTPEADESQLA
ncbi:MAG: HAMP domain-containing histidine kinase [Chloroflexi bacterium]|nr:MAG: HAMP domain-containing histidine kinase [Chloroflexota bacterium]TME47705.1 MAG: HAMP domain-containing histidine kinase [Chloroflexota bacterium]